VQLRTGVRVTGLRMSDDGVPRATGVAMDDGGAVDGDVVVDALGRYRCPPGWPRAAGEATDRERSTTAAISSSVTGSSTSTRRS
jgi:hypothetical protein